MSILTFADKEVLSQEAAKYIVMAAREAISTHGSFTMALSGGTTPGKTFALLAGEPYRDQIDWSLVQIFWCDERAVPPDSPDSNYRLAQETLLSKVPISARQIHRMPADTPDRDAASQLYIEEIRQVLGEDTVPRFDLIQLGMGPEAHTASLFPHQPSLQEKERLVMPVNVPKPPPDRLTFTLPLLNAAHHILFMITGADKADALYEVLEGERNPQEYPAQNIQPANGDVHWLLDTAAASKLTKKS